MTQPAEERSLTPAEYLAREREQPDKPELYSKVLPAGSDEVRA